MGNRHHVNTSPKALIVAIATAMTVSQMPVAAIAEVVVDTGAAQETQAQTVVFEPTGTPENTVASDENPQPGPETPGEDNTEGGGEAEEAPAPSVPKNDSVTHEDPGADEAAENTVGTDKTDTSVAEQAETDAVTTWAELTAAIKAAAPGDTVTVGADITVSASGQNVFTKAVTVDLAGHSLTSTATTGSYAFAFTGGATIKNGFITLGSLPYGMNIQANGVTFDNVAITYSGPKQAMHVQKADALRMVGGSVTATGAGSVAIVASASTVELSGTKISGPAAIQATSASKVGLTGCDVTATTGIALNVQKNTEFAVSGGRLTAPAATKTTPTMWVMDCAGTVTDGAQVIGDSADPQSRTVNVYDGSNVTFGPGTLVAGASTGISVNSQNGPATLTVQGNVEGLMVGVSNNGGTDQQASTITVADGASVKATSGSGAGLFLASPVGTAAVGRATVSGPTGIEVRGGTLDVNGATVTSTADAFSVTPNGSGSTTVGAAIAVSQHTHKAPVTVNVASGDFTGPVAFAETNPQQNPEDATKNISIDLAGGTFTGTSGSPVTSETQGRFVTGGLYNAANVAPYVKADAVDQAKGSGLWQIADTEAAEKDNAGYVEVDGVKVFYPTKDALEDAAEKTGTNPVYTAREAVWTVEVDPEIEVVEAKVGGAVEVWFEVENVGDVDLTGPLAVTGEGIDDYTLPFDTMGHPGKASGAFTWHLTEEALLTGTADVTATFTCGDASQEKSVTVKVPQEAREAARDQFAPTVEIVAGPEAPTVADVDAADILTIPCVVKNTSDNPAVFTTEGAEPVEIPAHGTVTVDVPFDVAGIDAAGAVVYAKTYTVERQGDPDGTFAVSGVLHSDHFCRVMTPDTSARISLSVPEGYKAPTKLEPGQTVSYEVLVKNEGERPVTSLKANGTEVLPEGTVIEPGDTYTVPMSRTVTEAETRFDPAWTDTFLAETPGGATKVSRPFALGTVEDPADDPAKDPADNPGEDPGDPADDQKSPQGPIDGIGPSGQTVRPATGAFVATPKDNTAAALKRTAGSAQVPALGGPADVAGALGALGTSGFLGALVSAVSRRFRS